LNQEGASFLGAQTAKKGPTVVSTSDIQGVRAASAYCRDGNKVGRVSDVFVDDLTNEPAWVTITAGLFGTKTLFAPLQGATLDGDRLVLAYDKDVIANAPAIADSGHLSDTEQQALTDYFTAHRAGNDAADVVVAAPVVEETAPPRGTDWFGSVESPLADASRASASDGEAPGSVIDSHGDQVTPVHAGINMGSETAAPMTSPYGGRTEEARLADNEDAGLMGGDPYEVPAGEPTIVDATQVEPADAAARESSTPVKEP
jgi:PRC-barrel domain